MYQNTQQVSDLWFAITGILVFFNLISIYIYLVIKCFSRHVHCLKCPLAILLLSFVALVHERWLESQGGVPFMIDWEGLRQYLGLGTLLAAGWCLLFGMRQGMRHEQARRSLQATLDHRFRDTFLVRRERDPHSDVRLLRVHPLRRPTRKALRALPASWRGFPVLLPGRKGDASSKPTTRERAKPAFSGKA